MPKVELKNKTKYYRTVVMTEILFEEPYPDDADLMSIADDINEEKNGKEIAQLLLSQGSDPGFFMLTEDGELTDEEDGP